MKKVAIQVEESVKYEDTIEVLQPSDMRDETFERLLEKAEKKIGWYGGGAKDLASELEELGLKVISETSSFPESPRTSELEILDVRDIKN